MKRMRETCNQKARQQHSIKFDEFIHLNLLTFEFMQQDEVNAYNEIRNTKHHLQ